MWAKPPTNLPGKPGVHYPNRPNTIRCPNCERPFMEADIGKKKGHEAECPYCGEKVDLTNKSQKNK